MNRFLRVATIALLLVEFTGTAFAQAGDPAAAGSGGSGGGAAAQKQPCHLTMVHYEALNSQIDDLRGRIGRLRADLEALGVVPPEGTDLEGFVGGGSTGSAQQQRHEELTAELKEANRQLVILVELQSRRPAKYAGWHWGVGLRGGLAMLTNDDDHSAGLVQAFSLARWIDNSHLGVEASAGIGAWPTGDSAPLMLSGRAAGIATWESWGLSLGPEVSFLATPLEGQEGGNVLTTLLLGGDFHAGGFLAQVFTGPTLHSEMKRTSGWWSGLGLGYYY